jgi:hypothetical protein
VKIDYPAGKIVQFTKNCLTESPVGSNPDDEKVVYRTFHRLLILDHHLQSNAADGCKEFARECVSDASMAYLLFFLNLNKSSLNSLRSSLENGWRYLLGSNGGSPSEIDSVPVLISESRALNLYDGMSTEIVNDGYILYKELCQAVHSSKDDYLTNDIPFQNLTKLKIEKSTTNLNLAGQVFRNILDTLIVSDFPVIKSLEAKSFDAVMDGLSKSLKRTITDV